MLHFLDDKNLVDGEREELNKILFQQNQEKAQCEFPFELNVPQAANFGRNNDINGASSNHGNNLIKESTTTTNSSSNYYQPKTTNIPVFLPNVGASTSGVGYIPTNAHLQQTTANVYLNHANANRTNLHRPNFLPAAISPYYIGLSYASPQYIVPTVRNSAAPIAAAVPAPFVYCPVQPPQPQQPLTQQPDVTVKQVLPDKVPVNDTQNALNEKIQADFTSPPIGNVSNSANVVDDDLSTATNEINLNNENFTYSNADGKDLLAQKDKTNVDRNFCDKDSSVATTNDNNSADDSKRDLTRVVHFQDESELKSTKNESGSNSTNLSEKLDDVVVVPTTTKSWASLFKNTNAVIVSKRSIDEITTTTNVIDAVVDVDGQASAGSMQINDGLVVEKTSVDHDPDALKLGTYLKSCSLIHRGPAFQLRGLINKGSWCYVNATLQALMVCPPFVHLLRHLKFMTVRSPSSTPMLDSLVKFVGEFAEKFPRKSAQDLDKGAPFEPSYVYNVLKIFRRDYSFRGRQEDAEEFLSLVLNRLHEEMLSCLSLADKINAVESRENAQTNKISDENQDDDDEWHQVGPKQKASITRTSKLSTTPVSEIFSGVFRNSIQHFGSKETINLESFFTLPLNVQSNEITSISSAFQFMNKEVFKTTSKNKEIDTTRRTTFQELPVVLILHLKFFVYTDEGVKKIVKPILYGMDLQMDWNLLSPTSNSAKSDKFNRTYKLFAVVFHHGDKAEGGHYTTDVFHGGFWINLDDSTVYPVDENHVLGFQPFRVPYLLFYRRCDSFSDSRSVAN